MKSIMMMEIAEVIEEYKSSLEDLTESNFILINILTKQAEKYEKFATAIAQAIQDHMFNVKNKLPAFHLLDSVIKKNSHYLKTFLPNIASLFCTVFKTAKKDMRSAMFQTRKSWAKLLPNDVLYCLDVNVRKMDPKWPILAHSNRTHANHKTSERKQPKKRSPPDTTAEPPQKKAKRSSPTLPPALQQLFQQNGCQENASKSATAPLTPELKDISAKESKHSRFSAAVSKPRYSEHKFEHTAEKEMIQTTKAAISGSPAAFTLQQAAPSVSKWAKFKAENPNLFPTSSKTISLQNFHHSTNPMIISGQQNTSSNTPQTITQDKISASITSTTVPVQPTSSKPANELQLEAREQKLVIKETQMKSTVPSAPHAVKVTLCEGMGNASEVAKCENDKVPKGSETSNSDDNIQVIVSTHTNTHVKDTESEAKVDKSEDDKVLKEPKTHVCELTERAVDDLYSEALKPTNGECSVEDTNYERDDCSLYSMLKEHGDQDESNDDTHGQQTNHSSSKYHKTEGNFTSQDDWGYCLATNYRH